jgi:mannose PTS system EIIA component
MLLGNHKSPLPAAVGKHQAKIGGLFQMMRQNGQSRMIGVVIVTHGQLAGELQAALEQVAGPQSQMESIAVGPDDDLALRRTEIAAAVTRADQGHGAVIMVDMFGGTPANLAVTAMVDGRVDVISGVNLPLLVKFAQVRSTCAMAEAITKAVLAGRKYVVVASQVLAGQFMDRPAIRVAAEERPGV